MKKEDLIYDAACEAVMRARINVQNEFCYLTIKERDKLDAILYRAMCNAGTFALKAYRADARKIKSISHLLKDKYPPGE